MTSDLKLNVGSRYTLVTLIFFIPYILFQPPATIALRKIGPRLFLSAITLFWGAVMIVSLRGCPISTGCPNAIAGCRLCKGLDCSVWFAIYARPARGWILSRLCISTKYLVSPLRSSETQCGFLPYWHRDDCCFGHLSVRTYANGRGGRSRRVEVDIHC